MFHKFTNGTPFVTIPEDIVTSEVRNVERVFEHHWGKGSEDYKDDGILQFFDHYIRSGFSSLILL